MTMSKLVASLARALRAQSMWLLLAVLATVGRAEAEPPAPGKVTPELVAAATAEGKVVWYTVVEITFAQKIAKAFEAKYPGIAVQLERNGSERNFQRLQQEYASGIHNADVIESADGSHFIIWKKDGWLVPYLPAGAATMSGQFRDPDGMFAPFRASLYPMGYNTKLVKAEDAPKSYADLLDPKWSGKIAKAHPGYSGAVMTVTTAIVRTLGWQFYEKLARQHVMQLQSGTDPVRKVALGERQVMAEGAEYVLLDEQARGSPIAAIYPPEGTPIAIYPAGVAKDAPHPNAARLLAEFLFSPETQQFMVDAGHLRSLNPAIKEPAGRPTLKDIKVLPDDPADTMAHSEEIKAKYPKLFGI